MAPRPREVKPVVSTSFPDLLGEEEARLNRLTYPSEVTFKRAIREDEDADGLLDELLNDGESLTDSDDDRTKESHVESVVEETPKLEETKPEQSPNGLFGGYLPFSVPTIDLLSLGSTPSKTDKESKTDKDAKTQKTPTDDTSKTDSERSMGRCEDEEEAIEILSIDDDETVEVGQEVALLDENEFIEDDGDDYDEEEEEKEEWEEENEDGAGDDEDEEEEGESVTSTSSDATQDLLERAHDRLNMQSLYEEIGQLRRAVERKDQEIEQLSGQLRRAVETKCDLVIAHTELERHHEFNLKQLEQATKQLLKANFGLVEEQASTDVELMNEIVRLNQEIKEMKSLHIQELGDWERLHMNEIREKEFEIAKLNEEIRRLKVGTTVGRKQKKMLGLARQ